MFSLIYLGVNRLYARIFGAFSWSIFSTRETYFCFTPAWDKEVGPRESTEIFLFLSFVLRLRNLAMLFS